MQKDSIEEQKIQQAKNNILRGEDIDSAAYILEKYMFDGVFFIGGRVNPVKVATRQVLNFIKRYQKSDYETICLENNEMKEILDKIQLEYNNLLKENEELKIKNNAIKRESEAYAENMIRLDNELNLEKEKSKYEWIRQNCLPQELVNKLYIPIQKVKDKIKKEIKYHEENILDIENITMLKGKTAKEEAEIEFNKYAIVVLKKMLQELLEGRK